MTVIKRCPKGIMALDLLVARCTTPLMLGYNLLNPIPFYPHCEASLHPLIRIQNCQL